MSNVASLENCKELYELSKWEDEQDLWYDAFMHVSGEVAYYENPTYEPVREEAIPAYELGCLLRKLPQRIKDAVIYLSWGDEGWAFGYVHSPAEIRDGKSLWVQRVDYKAVADTPEDALCSLAISLFKKGILK